MYVFYMPFVSDQKSIHGKQISTDLLKYFYELDVLYSSDEQSNLIH